MIIKVLEEEFSICKLKDISEVDFNQEFCFYGKTDEEISLVCITGSVPNNTIEREDGWRAFRIEGILDFSLTGILSKISSILAKEKIGIFAISTFNTDYILVKEENLSKSIKVLSKEYTVNQSYNYKEADAVDQYISEFPDEIQEILSNIREVIRKAAPNATEKISYKMPTFWQKENLIHFAAFKKHISIFPGGEATKYFEDKLTEYKTSKGTIQFQLNELIPYDLIEEVTLWRVKTVEEKEKEKKTQKRNRKTVD